MRSPLFTFTLAMLILSFLSCSTSQKVMQAEPVTMESRDLDTMIVSPETHGVIHSDEEVEIPNERPVYHGAYHRTVDLLHTRLDLSFDWEKEQVNGRATLRFTPLASPVKEFELDAKNFDFHSIKFFNGTSLDYTYEGDKQKVIIKLDRAYDRGEEFEIVFDYTATPAQSGGSAAITSDKGLFFINPRGEEAGKPRQIWTQGETENNSRWFPTIDKPNERCTQEMYLTVDDSFKTLSNGYLVSQNKNSDGTRTDYWRQDKPHAPYLFMLTVGDFDIVEDQKWNGIPVNYYLEPKWSKYAKDIFPHTREMLTFFSDLTGVSYPWAKYSQVAVRDYVSGAMENTTAVIFGEFMHGTDRDLIDVDINEKIVAHEMFHHWFGDYVTTESWSNLTLNEGFANYSEYLWLEKKHGKDAADYHMLQERGGYLGSVRRGEPHELIWYDYEDKEQMFDAHSYNKGGAVLHMLRTYLGDDIFFRSLEHYLTTNQYSAVEVDELRLAFEDISGEDLNWFFDQWFLQAGHPKLSLETTYADGKIMLTVEQTQSTENNVPAIFKLPVKVNVYTQGNKLPTTHDIVVDQRKQTFTFESATQPDVVIFDPSHAILAEYDYTKSTEELAHQFRVAPNVIDRQLVLQRLNNKDDSSEKRAVFTNALKDPFYVIRGVALRSIEEPTPEQVTLIRNIAESDPHSSPRALALEVLTQQKDDQAMRLAEKALDARSYDVVAQGLRTLAEFDPAKASQIAVNLEEVDNPTIINSVIKIYVDDKNLGKLPFIEKQMKSLDGYSIMSLYNSYGELISSADPNVLEEGITFLNDIATNKSKTLWQRLAATQTLNSFLKNDSLDQEVKTNVLNYINAIKTQETDPQLQQIYQQFGG